MAADRLLIPTKYPSKGMHLHIPLWGYNGPMTKTCKVCSATENNAEFYNGVNNKCKSCHKEAVKINRDQNAEYYKNYDAKRFQSDPKVKARHKRYQATPAGKASMGKSRLKWMNHKPEARAAHIILGNAVRDGRIEKPCVCTKCKKTEVSRKMHAHHKDYAFPLNVIWLCAQCHHDEHS